MKIKKLAQNASLNYIKKEFDSLQKMMDVTWYGDSMVDTEFRIEKLINNIKVEIKKYNKEAFPHLLELYKRFYVRVSPRIKKVTNKNISVESLPNFIKSNIEKFNENEARLMIDVFNIVPNNAWFGSVIENLNTAYEPKIKLLKEYEQILNANQHLFVKNAYKIALELSRDKINLTREEIVFLETIKNIWFKYASLIRSNLKDLYLLSEAHGENATNKTLQNQDQFRKNWIKRVLNKISLLKSEFVNYKTGHGDEDEFMAITNYDFEQFERVLGGILHQTVSYLPKDLREEYISKIKSFSWAVGEGSYVGPYREAEIINKMDKKRNQPKDVASFNFENEDLEEITDDEIEVVEDDKKETNKPTEEPKQKSWWQKINPINLFSKSDQELSDDFIKFANLLK